jgi:hypothetical protein
LVKVCTFDDALNLKSNLYPKQQLILSVSAILFFSQTLISHAREFEELADTCLLVLHLEVRVHCFHYLHPIWRGPAGAQFSGGQVPLK